MGDKKQRREAVDEAPAAESDAPAADLPRKTVGELAEDRGIAPGYWKLTVAKTHRGWSEQRLVTEEEFEAAMNEISNQVIR